MVCVTLVSLQFNTSTVALSFGNIYYSISQNFQLYVILEMSNTALYQDLKNTYYVFQNILQ